MESYLNNCNICKVAKEDLRNLTAPISMSELQLAINRLKTGKASGGLTAIYYLKNQNALIEALKDTMNRILVTGEVPAV